jgi:5-methylcytosine-specific restriction endonuclease McrA
MKEIKSIGILFVSFTKEYITSMNAAGKTIFCRNDRWYLSDGKNITQLKEKSIRKVEKQASFAALHPELYADFDKKAAFEFLIEKYGKRCLNCNTTKRLIVDHIIPRRRGGTNDYSNLQILCIPCNFRKGLWNGLTIKILKEDAHFILLPESFGYT